MPRIVAVYNHCVLSHLLSALDSHNNTLLITVSHSDALSPPLPFNMQGGWKIVA